MDNQHVIARISVAANLSRAVEAQPQGSGAFSEIALGSHGNWLLAGFVDDLGAFAGAVGASCARSIEQLYRQLHCAPRPVTLSSDDPSTKPSTSSTLNSSMSRIACPKPLAPGWRRDVIERRRRSLKIGENSLRRGARKLDIFGRRADCYTRDRRRRRKDHDEVLSLRTGTPPANSAPVADLDSVGNTRFRGSIAEHRERSRFRLTDPRANGLPGPRLSCPAHDDVVRDGGRRRKAKSSVDPLFDNVPAAEILRAEQLSAAQT